MFTNKYIHLLYKKIFWFTCGEPQAQFLSCEYTEKKCYAENISVNLFWITEGKHSKLLSEAIFQRNNYTIICLFMTKLQSEWIRLRPLGNLFKSPSKFNFTFIRLATNANNKKTLHVQQLTDNILGRGLQIMVFILRVALFTLYDSMIHLKPE